MAIFIHLLVITEAPLNSSGKLGWKHSESALEYGSAIAYLAEIAILTLDKSKLTIPDCKITVIGKNTNFFTAHWFLE